ncbi:hypothetical protein ONS95_009259 [Cadophora gregata]|uniref:uncharacterized protein n=1 Tax=Cadophora gregata TaxID=51156 RepID=UPI0026DCFD1E|nr:uncharacterized protein ONS95_009259 [Cadophora gregata]KAK0124287.1 hypothetical protein ONS95_009259 [Cadophora gregata]
MDGILGEEAPQPDKPKKVRIKKARRPDPIVSNYKKKPSEFFLFLVNELRYEKFANDVQALNPDFVKRGYMESICKYKTLRIHHSEWNDRSSTHLDKKKVLRYANSQTSGYDGFDPKEYWELQRLVNGLDGMTVAGKEPKVQKNLHFKAMQEARLRKKVERRLMAKTVEQKTPKEEYHAMGSLRLFGSTGNALAI